MFPGIFCPVAIILSPPWQQFISVIGLLVVLNQVARKRRPQIAVEFFYCGELVLVLQPHLVPSLNLNDRHLCWRQIRVVNVICEQFCNHTSVMEQVCASSVAWCVGQNDVENIQPWLGRNKMAWLGVVRLTDVCDHVVEYDVLV